MFPSKRPLFYYVTDRKQLPRKSLLESIRRAVAWGVDFVQIREKDLSDRQLFALTSRVLAVARGSRCQILVNGRADIAVVTGAHGVHLPSGFVDVPDLRFWLPKGFVVGVSAHSKEEAVRAATMGADYVLLGPVFLTESKIRYGRPLGLSYFRRVCSAVPIPIFGLGGIHAESVAQVLEAGAAGVAGIRLFQKELDALSPPGRKHRRNQKPISTRPAFQP